MLRRTEDLYGFILKATDGLIGTVHDLYFDDETWTVGYLLAQDAEAWPITRFVLLPPRVLEALVWDKRRGSVGLTRKQVILGPDIDPSPVLSWHQCEELDERFAAIKPTTIETAATDKEREGYSGITAKCRRQFLSARDMVTYRVEIEATEIGRVQDVLFDDETWAIRYLHVDCSTWSPARRELIPPECIVRLSQPEGTIFAVPRHRLAPTG